MNTAKQLFDYGYDKTGKQSGNNLIWEKLGEPVFFPANHVFVEAEEQVEFCYFVKKGRVAAFHIYPNGEERIFELHDAGQLFLENSLLFQAHSPVSYKTICATELVRINKCRLKKAIKEDPSLALDVMCQTSLKYHSSMDRLRNTTTQNVSWKVCDFFLTFAERYGIPYNGRILIQEKISQQFISNYIGTNRITVVRIVKELKSLGLIEKIGKFYYVCDIEGLRDYQMRIDKNA